MDCDTTFRGWSASRVKLVISRLSLTFVIPLCFHGRLRVIRSMFSRELSKALRLPLWLCVVYVSCALPFLKFVWSYRQLLANVGAVLSLLDGPQGVILHTVLYGFGFGWFGGILLTAQLRWVGVIACWIWSGKGAMRMAPSIWWSPVPLLLGFQ